MPRKPGSPAWLVAWRANHPCRFFYVKDPKKHKKRMEAFEKGEFVLDLPKEKNLVKIPP